MCVRDLQDDRLLFIEEENNIFQSTYKNIIGCKSSKHHGYGYMAKYSTRRQLMEAQINEHARASVAAHQKTFSLRAKFNSWKSSLQMKLLQGTKYWKKIGDKFRRTSRKPGRC
jgi:hypothetical protein